MVRNLSYCVCLHRLSYLCSFITLCSRCKMMTGADITKDSLPKAHTVHLVVWVTGMNSCVTKMPPPQLKYGKLLAIYCIQKILFPKATLKVNCYLILIFKKPTIIIKTVVFAVVILKIVNALSCRDLTIHSQNL